MLVQELETKHVMALTQVITHDIALYQLSRACQICSRIDRVDAFKLLCTVDVISGFAPEKGYLLRT